MPKSDITKAPEIGVSRPRDMFTAMRDEMDRVLERFEHGFPHWPSLFRHGGAGGLAPELDVRESATDVTIEAELPGVEEKDISVTLANGILPIKGEKKQSREEKNESFHVSERSYGSFERSLRLPESIDEAKVNAKFEKGVLKISAAKKPEAVKVERKIEISKSS
jgi:HSP20 family protein